MLVGAKVCDLTEDLCGLYVVCMWFVCGLYVVCMWFVCGLYVVCMWFVCGLYVEILTSSLDAIYFSYSITNS